MHRERMRQGQPPGQLMLLPVLPTAPTPVLPTEPGRNNGICQDCGERLGEAASGKLWHRWKETEGTSRGKTYLVPCPVTGSTEHGYSERGTRRLQVRPSNGRSPIK